MTTTAITLGRRLQDAVLAPMKRTFVGKDEIIDLMGVCLVAGENLFLLGPPGTAKSALVHELGRRLDGRSFDYLLTRFTEPNELFGPFDIRRLKDGDLVTNTEGMLPEADFVFLDELLNANSAILNSLLMVLNERVFRRGRETRRLPMLMAVGASNRLPEEEALRALFDRFLARVRCDNVPEARLTEVLDAGWRLARPEAAPPTLHPDEVRELQAIVPQVDMSAARQDYLDLIGKLRRAGIAVSDRRAVKLQRLVAASAILCGRTQALASDCWVLAHTWETEEQQEVIAAILQPLLERSVGDQPAHPQAQARTAPDPEHLARDLASLATELDAGPDAVGLARLRDRLGLLTGRCQWVTTAVQRTALQATIDGLWQRLTR